MLKKKLFRNSRIKIKMFDIISKSLIKYLLITNLDKNLVNN